MPPLKVNEGPPETGAQTIATAPTPKRVTSTLLGQDHLAGLVLLPIDPASAVRDGSAHPDIAAFSQNAPTAFPSTRRSRPQRHRPADGKADQYLMYLTGLPYEPQTSL
jgi:hypothetical protein